MNNQPKILDVAIIGAGISGIGSAYWLQKKCPNKSFQIFESRSDFGGTWSLFNYPGIRSDSDMFTFGYKFKPWKEKEALASGKTILNYLSSVVTENRLKNKIKFNHHTIDAKWNSEENLWTLKIKHKEEEIIQKARYLLTCTGYYNYEEAFKPTFKGEENYKGTIVLPQFWPKDLDYTNKKVIIIGSGATAVTLLPSMVQKGAAHVTMLQRSPSYIVSLPNKNNLYLFFKKFLPLPIAYQLVRSLRILLGIGFYSFCQSFPELTKKILINQVKKQLPNGYDVEKHFTPTYFPWDQRLCIVPDGDFFKVLSEEKASIETEVISHLTEKGIVTVSGKELDVDIIVFATGLNIKLLGGIKLFVDGKEIINNQHISYKAMMVNDVPNFVTFFGYTNSSWTLRVDLISNYFCKLLNYLDKNNYTFFMPVFSGDKTMEKHSILEELNSGYLKRSVDKFILQGKKNPWRGYQNYIKDMIYTRFSKVNDNILKFK